MKRLSLLICLISIGYFSFSQKTQPSGNLNTCPQDYPNNPYWMSGYNKLYTPCPDMKVGIREYNPLYALHVKGDGYFTGNMGIGVAPDPNIRVNVRTNQSIGFNINHTNGFSNGYSFKTTVHDESTIGFGMYNQLYQKNVFAIYANGKMEISNGSQKILQLESNGLLRARKIKIDLDNWADYVFDPSYELMPLDKVEAYVKEEKHLPAVPSESQLMEQGMDVEEINKILMMKVEELTLYLIDQNKSIEELKARISELESNK